MEEIMVTVPFGDFKDGVMAMADLDSIRALISVNEGYCSDAIKAVLGLPVEKKGE